MTFVVMTSNLGTSATRSGFGAGDLDSRDAARAVRDHFRPEFINRLDEIVPFSALSPQSLRRIVELELEEIVRREGIVSRELRIEVSELAKDRLAALGHDSKYGARPLKRMIEDRVMAPIAVELARRPNLKQRRVEVDCVGTEIEVRFCST
jgi:ATP-dependent Clp protease ATP-binding subunit ClpC